MGSHRRVLYVAGAVGAIAVIATLILLLVPKGEAHSPKPAAVASPVFDQASARALSSRLTSGQPAEVAQSVLVPPKQSLPRTFVTSMHQLRRLTFDVSTFKNHGDGTATVVASLQDAAGHSTTWTVDLVSNAGAWKVATTASAATHATP